MEHAWNPTKREAALTILAHQIGKPQTLQAASRYGPEVVVGSTWLGEKQWDSEMWTVAALSVALVSGISILLVYLFKAAELIFVQSQPWLPVLIALILVLFVILGPFVLIAWFIVRHQLTKAKTFRRGREGEDWVTDKIRALLDNRWVVFRNLKLPKRKEDIDVVLVGPSGVWALEIKSFACPVRVRAKAWEKLTGKKWRALGSDPVGQVRTNAKHLRYFLEHRGVVLRVNAAVVFTQPQQVTNFGPTDEPVWKQFEVDDKLTYLNQQPAKFSDTERERMVKALRDIGEDGKKRPKGTGR